MKQQNVEIFKLDHNGRGIGKLDGKTVFVPNTLPGETVTLKNVVAKKKYIEAEVLEFIHTSEKRQQPKCPYFDQCGGCDLMHLPYQDQIEYKKDKIKDILCRFSDIDEKMVTTITGGEEFYYRNKVTFHVNKVCGLYKKKSYEIIPVDNCDIIHEDMNEVLSLIRHHMKLDFIESIVLRHSKRTNEMMVIFYLKGKAKLDLSFLESKVTSIYTVYDRRYRCVYGKEYITEEILGLSFDISPTAFFQVNTEVCEKLYQQVQTYLKPTKQDLLLDLYCGTGTIGLTLAHAVQKVIGVESNAASVRDAKRNKEKNKIRNAEFYTSKVADVIEQMRGSLVVVDPPRAGLDMKTKKELKKIQPKRLVYVSCDPMTMIRDLKELASDFDIQEISLFDMFPNTDDVESVCLLTSK